VIEKCVERTDIVLSNPNTLEYNKRILQRPAKGERYEEHDQTFTEFLRRLKDILQT
jgi:hypothetical protein